MSNRLDVVAIGNAIVDVVAQVEDSFLGANAVEKGIMTLIDQDRASALYGAMPAATEISGGSAANTAAGAAAIDAKVGFLERCAKINWARSLPTTSVPLALNMLTNHWSGQCCRNITLPGHGVAGWRAFDEHVPWCFRRSAGGRHR